MAIPIPLDGLLDVGQPMPACNCGGSGDAESLASLTGIQNNLLPYWLTKYPGHELSGLPIGKAAKLVRKYAEDNDEMTLAIFRQQAMAIGRLFTIAANFLDPDAYFLGGGVVEAASPGEAPMAGRPSGHGLGSSTSFGNWGAVGWAAASGVCGSSGLIAFYAGFAAAPISVVAPVAALVSTVLPVGVAIADGEHLTASMIAGGLICLAAIVMVSMPPARRPAGVGRMEAARARATAGMTGTTPPAGSAASSMVSPPAPDSDCSSCTSRTPCSPVCSGRWRSRGRREPWSPSASRWRPGHARGGTRAVAPA